MTLPRFTSGQFGRLDFSHLNDAFGYIDEMRGTSPPTGRAPKDPGFIVARIGQTGLDLGVQPTAGLALQWLGHYWNEVTSPGTNWVDLPNGRASGSLTTGNPVDAVKFPALSLTGKTLDLNTIAILFPQSTIGTEQYPSQAFYAAVQIPEGPQPMRIESSQVIAGSIGRWTYTVTKMRWNAFDKLFEPVSDSITYPAYNTLESLIDNAPANSFGVGSIRPTSATVVRQPIKNGAVVMSTQLGPHWHFSVPNGYQVTC